MAIIPIGGYINNSMAVPNDSKKYGPYSASGQKSALQVAFETLDGDDVLCVGLTVGIINEDGSIDEYWFKSACSSVNDLVKKNSGSGSGFNPSYDQQRALDSGITTEKVATYDGYATGKQNALSEAQQAAVDSGITAEKVAAHDGKQNALTTAQMNAVNSGITGDKVDKYEGYESGKQNALSSAQLAAANSGVTSDRVKLYNDTYDVVSDSRYGSLDIVIDTAKQLQANSDKSKWTLVATSTDQCYGRPSQVFTLKKPIIPNVGFKESTSVYSITLLVEETANSNVFVVAPTFLKKGTNTVTVPNIPWADLEESEDDSATASTESNSNTAVIDTYVGRRFIALVTKGTQTLTADEVPACQFWFKSNNILDLLGQDGLIEVAGQSGGGFTPTDAQTAAMNSGASADIINTLVDSVYKDDGKFHTIYVNNTKRSVSIGGSPDSWGAGSFSFGDYTEASGDGSFAHGYGGRAYGRESHCEGRNCRAYSTANGSHAEGMSCETQSNYSHAEGISSITSGDYAHAEGKKTLASGSYSHSEGYSLAASFLPSQDYEISAGAEKTISVKSFASNSELHIGFNLEDNKDCIVTGFDSNTKTITIKNNGETVVKFFSTQYFAFVGKNESRGTGSHSEGIRTLASGKGSHSEGYFTSAAGDYSHTEGAGTKTSNTAEHAAGTYNSSRNGGSDGVDTLFSIGCGSSDSARKNAFEVMKNGDAFFAGKVYLEKFENIHDSSKKDVKTQLDELNASVAAVKPYTRLTPSDYLDTDDDVYYVDLKPILGDAVLDLRNATKEINLYVYDTYMNDFVLYFSGTNSPNFCNGASLEPEAEYYGFDKLRKIGDVSFEEDKEYIMTIFDGVIIYGELNSDL